MPGMVGPKLNPQTMAEMYGARAAAADLCQRELTNQRMHRYPVPEPKPFSNPNAYSSTAVRSYVALDRPGRGTPSFTVGWKNELGTKTHTKQLSMAEFKATKLALAAEGDPAAGSYSSTAMDAYAAPDASHVSQGATAPRGGVAGRMPFSEVDRHFFTSTSKGTLPGDPHYAPAGGASAANSETRTQYGLKAIPAREPPRVTVRRLNDLGTRETSHVVPPEQLLRTNYELGTDALLHSTAARDAARAPPPNAWKLAPSAAGQKVGVGPSEVERGFRQPHNSADYNIVSNGPRLGASSGGSSDAHLRSRNAGAFERPVGRSQCPDNNPRDRGPTGSRQSYDIISGLDRPRERWNFQS